MRVIPRCSMRPRPSGLETKTNLKYCNTTLKKTYTAAFKGNKKYNNFCFKMWFYANG